MTETVARKPRPAPPVGESRADQILREAGLLFREKGYENTRMEDIAQAVNLTQGALYRHFSSKEEILYQHLLAYQVPWFATVREAAGSGPPDRQLQAYIRAYVRYQFQQPFAKLGWGGLARTGQLLWRLPEEQRNEIGDITHNVVFHLEDILTRGVEAGVFRKLDIQLTAAFILNMSFVLGAWTKPSGEFDPATLPDICADLAMHMVLADPATLDIPPDGR